MHCKADSSWSYTQAKTPHMKTQEATDFSSHQCFSVGLLLRTALPFQRHGTN